MASLLRSLSARGRKSAYAVAQERKLAEAEVRAAAGGRLGPKSGSLASLPIISRIGAKGAQGEAAASKGRIAEMGPLEPQVKLRKATKRKSRDYVRHSVAVHGGEADRDEVTVVGEKLANGTPHPRGKKAKRKSAAGADDSALAEQFESAAAAASPPATGHKGGGPPAARRSPHSVSSGVSSMADAEHALSESSRKKLRRKRRPADGDVFAPAGDKRSVSPAGAPGLLMYDSEEEARVHLRWLIRPTPVDKFFSEYFERDVLHIDRQLPTYYGDLFSTATFDETLRNHELEFGANVNLARYVDGERQTLNPCGRAFPSVVWQFYEKEGCSVQFVNPQSFVPAVRALCTRLQELFCCFVGANTYLTPAGTQGFAPHWDEIDAFILHMEGAKYWKVYRPRDDGELLPRESSGNFSESDVSDMQIAFEGWLRPGDLLYIPRGFVHQGFADQSAHSLHVTVSVNRRNTFADLFEKLVPELLSDCAASVPAFRRSLPPRYLSYMGVSNAALLDDAADSSSSDGAGEHNGVVDDSAMNVDEARPPIADLAACRSHFMKSYRSMARTLGERLLSLADAGCDMAAGEFLKQALPPLLNQSERAATIHGSDARWDGGKKAPDGFVRIAADTGVKLVRKHAQRIIFESEESARIEHRVHNSLVFEQRKSPPVPIEPNMVDAFEQLARTYPAYIAVGELEAESIDTKIELCERLWNAGLLMVEK